jgi:hypothetical protein
MSSIRMKTMFGFVSASLLQALQNPARKAQVRRGIDSFIKKLSDFF